jgi:hypothetical protein
MVGTRRHPGPRTADGRLKHGCCGIPIVRLARGRLGRLRSISARLANILDLASGGRKRVLHRDLDLLVTFFVRRGVADDDVFLGRHRQKDVDLESCPMPMAVTWTDHGHPAGGDAFVVRFEPLEFTLDVRPNWIRWLASLKYDLKRVLHLGLSLMPMSGMGNHQSTTPEMVAAQMPIPEISVVPIARRKTMRLKRREARCRRERQRQGGLSSFRP